MLAHAATVVWSAAGIRAAAHHAVTMFLVSLPIDGKTSKVARAPRRHASVRYRSLQTPAVPKASAFCLSKIRTCPPALQVTSDILASSPQHFMHGTFPLWWTIKTGWDKKLLKSTSSRLKCSVVSSSLS